MLVDQIIKSIETKDILAFEKTWNNLKNNMRETEKQDLLVEIIQNHYRERDFGYFIKVLDKIVDSKVSLDFNIDHWAPTFLSLTITKSSLQLFNYFIRKGAKINFIGDRYAFSSADIVKYETEELGNIRYSTCLDFAELKLSDDFTVHYNYAVPETNEHFKSWQDFDLKEEITISKRNYFYLIEQSQYLHDLIHTQRLINHIKSLGGKTYDQLMSKSVN
jgi:hypothetical protein